MTEMNDAEKHHCQRLPSATALTALALVRGILHGMMEDAGNPGGPLPSTVYVLANPRQLQKGGEPKARGSKYSTTVV